MTIVLVLLIFILLLLLFSPINYNLASSYYENFSLNTNISYGILSGFQISWQDKVCHSQIKILGIPIKIKGSKTIREKKVKKQEKKKNYSFPKIIKSFLENGIHQLCWRLLKDLLTMSKPDFLEFKGKWGFFEPDYTACSLAFIALINKINKNYLLDLQPVWDEEYFEYTLQVRGKFVPALLIFSFMKVLLNKSTLRFFLDIKKSRKKNSSFLLQPAGLIPGIVK